MTENAEQQLRDLDTAYDTIFNEVHKRAFFHRLKQYGIEPTTEKEAQTLLEIGTKFVVMATDEAPSSEKDAEDRFAVLNTALDGLVDPSQADLEEIKTAAFELASNPEIYKAALVLRKAQVEEPAQSQSKQSEEESSEV